MKLSRFAANVRFFSEKTRENCFFVSKLSLGVFVFSVFLRMLRRKAGDFLGKEEENVEKMEHFSRGVVKVKKKRKAIRNATALRARPAFFVFCLHLFTQRR